MATVLHPPEATLPVEERFILHDVNWETYEQLLANYLDRSNPRFTYDRGVLEIMSPSSEHEELTEIITQLVYILAEEWGLEYRNFGRTTFRHRDTEAGFEPVSCFYIQSVESISGVRRIDLSVHPPPDIVIEVEMTSPALKKLPVYARVSVPEVWRYDGKEVRIMLRQADDYLESEASKAIPRLTSSDVSQLVEQSKRMKRSVWIRAVRQWAGAH